MGRSAAPYPPGRDLVWGLEQAVHAVGLAQGSPSGTWPPPDRLSSAPAKRVFHRAEPSVVIAVDAVSIDAEENLDCVPSPLTDQERWVPTLRRQETPACRKS